MNQSPTLTLFMQLSKISISKQLADPLRFQFTEKIGQWYYLANTFFLALESFLHPRGSDNLPFKNDYLSSGPTMSFLYTPLSDHYPLSYGTRILRDARQDAPQPIVLSDE